MENSRPTFFLVNDDGIDSPGMACLGDTFSEIGDLYVFAPDGERSAQSRAITFVRPLRPRDHPVPFPAVRSMAINGSPADCAKLGLHKLLDFRPDFLLSGVNLGNNVGVDIHYSGTVGAAFEGYHLGIPSLALSLAIGREEKPDWGEVKKILFWVFGRLQKYKLLRKNTLFNINIPNIPWDEVRGMRFVPVARTHYRECYRREIDSEGNEVYQLQGELVFEGDHRETDLAVRGERVVTLSPLTGDPTFSDQLHKIHQQVGTEIGIFD